MHDISRSASRGFSLVELVCVIVVIGVLAAVGMRAFADFRFEARTAALDRIGTAIGANMQAAMAQYIVSGQGNTVTLNGRTIPVFPAGSASTWFSGNPAIPTGAPTGPAMFVMLGCGNTLPAVSATTPYPCASLPGTYFWVQQDLLSITNDPEGNASCWVYYFPYAGGSAPGWGTFYGDDGIWISAQYVGWAKEYQRGTQFGFRGC